MAQPPNIDGILITWGDRLFYTGNRVDRVKPPQPKLSGAAARLRAAAIRKRIESTVVRCAPQVMVKATGGERGRRAFISHFATWFACADFECSGLRKLRAERLKTRQVDALSDWFNVTAV